MDNSLSVCYIVRNEAENLPISLNSIKDIVSEIIIVDTGSTDNTREIAQEYGAKIYDFPWVDDFSAARNESVKYATGDWILIFDADFIFEAFSKAKLKSHLANKNIQLYYLNCIEEKENKQHPLNFLFRNHLGIKFRGRIHEQVVFGHKKSSAAFSDLYIRHTGYSDPETLKLKIKRNNQLFRLSLQNDNLSNLEILRYQAYLFINEIKARELTEEILINKIFAFIDNIEKINESRNYPQLLESFFIAALYYLYTINQSESFFKVLINGLRLFPFSLNLLFYLSKWFFFDDDFLNSGKTLNYMVYLVITRNQSIYEFELKREFLDPDYLNYQIVSCYSEIGDTEASEFYINKISNKGYLKQLPEEELLNNNPDNNALENLRTSREYLILADYQTAKKYFYLALDLAESENNLNILMLVVCDLIKNARVLDITNPELNKYIEQGKQLYSNSAYFCFSLGTYYMSVNDYQSAIKNFENALKLIRDDHDLLFNTNAPIPLNVNLKTVNILISESQQKTYFYDLLLKNIRECLNKLK